MAIKSSYFMIRYRPIISFAYYYFQWDPSLNIDSRNLISDQYEMIFVFFWNEI